jgi:GMP synthase (glutamine-hydrolysing)
LLLTKRPAIARVRCVQPFLFLGIRPEDVAADDEYAAMLRCSGLDEAQLRRHRLEQEPLEVLDLTRWSGVILGGGPFQVSDPQDRKSALQVRVEADLARLLDRIIPADFPFLGCCYGIGTLGRHQGAVVDRTFGEPVGAITVALTPEGLADPLFAEAGADFEAFVGHKEAIRRLPGHAVALASSDRCPVQAFRVGARAYATQFHPELDFDGFATRVQTYKFAGYFAPEEAEAIIAAARARGIGQTPNLIARFVELFASD